MTKTASQIASKVLEKTAISQRGAYNALMSAVNKVETKDPLNLSKILEVFERAPRTNLRAQGVPRQQMPSAYQALMKNRQAA
jgi:hypothetical protein